MSATKARPKRRKSTKPRQDAYKLVTDRILETMEQGVVPWHKPWRSTSDRPLSLSSRKPYRGVNVWTLGATAMALGYGSRWWGTYKQIEDLGGQVRKGEKSTPVVFWKFIEKRDEAGEVESRIPLLRYFPVFNLAQADGVEELKSQFIVPLGDLAPLDECELVSESYRLAGGPELSHGGNRAAYSPLLDKVMMPVRGAFDTVEHYYGTLFHEFAHSTGHESRLKRKTLVEPAPFGSEDYSREELVAEMAAAFICGEAGIEPNIPGHAAYIDHWSASLRDDPKLFVQAASQAQRAADLVLGLTADVTTDETKGVAG